MEKALIQVLTKFIETLDRLDNRLKRLEELEDKSKEPQLQKRLIPLAKWNNYHDWPSVSSLRWLRFMGHANGFNKVCKQIGKRLVIDEQAFFVWIKENPKIDTSRIYSKQKL